YDCELEPNSKAYDVYGHTHISERHRHRYEFNNDYLNAFNENGMRTVGKNPHTGLVEVIEYSKNDFFIGTQYHPEYKSTVENPHPLFVGFVKACKQHHDKKLANAVGAAKKVLSPEVND